MNSLHVVHAVNQTWAHTSDRWRFSLPRQLATSRGSRGASREIVVGATKLILNPYKIPYKLINPEHSEVLNQIPEIGAHAGHQNLELMEHLAQTMGEGVPWLDHIGFKGLGL